MKLELLNPTHYQLKAGNKAIELYDALVALRKKQNELLDKSIDDIENLVPLADDVLEVFYTNIHLDYVLNYIKFEIP